jgi:hypothetical protein
MNQALALDVIDVVRIWKGIILIRERRKSTMLGSGKERPREAWR